VDMNKETFDQYTIAKLSLMYSMVFLIKDKIHLLIGGITSSSPRATALSIASDSLEDFLDRGVTE